MKYLYLPGFSKKNKNELDSFVTYFSGKDIQLITHSWMHWEDESIQWNLETEITNILNTLDPTMEYTLIAKSYGTYVGAQLASKLKFKRAVLMGIPYIDLTDKELQAYNNILIKNLTIFHRINDPHGMLTEVQSIIKPDMAEYIVLEGDTHDYNIPELVYTKLIEK